MAGGAQSISLAFKSGWGNCWEHKTVVHELLHAVGLWHEQQRYDRDNYISINDDNIAKVYKSQFDIKRTNESSTYGLPYDYLSVMHYHKTAFTKGGGAVTIETHDPLMQDRIGRVKSGSEIDYETVRRIYQCSGTYPSVPTPPAPQCKDEITYCDQPHLMKVCGEYAATESCRRSCGYCTTDCKDEISYCYQYRQECGKLDWMKTSCRATCKLCYPF
jgi:hypothetical protein